MHEQDNLATATGCSYPRGYACAPGDLFRRMPPFLTRCEILHRREPGSGSTELPGDRPCPPHRPAVREDRRGLLGDYGIVPARLDDLEPSMATDHTVFH